MDIIFKESAFRHNLDEAEIRHAFMNPCYDGPIENDDKKNNHEPKGRYIRLGFDKSGNLLEILYNEYDTYVCIFHAMKCRSIFFSLLEA
jgi:hypothetical protein